MEVEPERITELRAFVAARFAMVAALVGADLLILLSDVDGLYTDDPRVNPDAGFIEFVPKLDRKMMEMGKASTGSGVGTGGMHAKLSAAHIATKSGCDMIIVNSAKGMQIIHDAASGENVGTLFCADPDESFDLQDYVEELN